MNFAYVGDVIAIPFFAMSFIYYTFYQKPHNFIEYTLCLFFLCGLIADSYFVLFEVQFKKV